MTQNKKSIETYYSNISGSYDTLANSAQYAVPSFIQEQANSLSKSNLSVLDLACGNGYLGKFLLSLGISPTSLAGYDLSPSMVDEAKKTSIYTQIGVCDLEQGLPPIQPETVDLCLAFGLFEFIQNENKLLSSITSALKPNGKIWCTFETPLSADQVEIVDIIFGDLPLKKFRKSENYIKKAFELAGLKITEIKKARGYVSPSSKDEVFYTFVRAAK